jgi:Carboxypeptidase regulatory-like domain
MVMGDKGKISMAVCRTGRPVRFAPGKTFLLARMRALGRCAGLLALLSLAALPALAQQERGEIDLQVRDPNGGAMQAAVQLSSDVNQVSRTFQTDVSGKYAATNLPFGVYQLRVSKQGFLFVQRSARRAVSAQSCP